MKVSALDLPEIKLIEPRVFSDDRGFFLETFEQQRYQQLLETDLCFVQDNFSRSHRHVLRGMHFQRTRPQGKLVRVVQGAVFDVAVDVRPESATLGQWAGAVLSAENRAQLWVPPGFAHGFVVLSELADFEYKCTDYYCPQDEACLHWADADVDIAWPVSTPQLSDKDRAGLSLRALLACSQYPTK